MSADRCAKCGAEIKGTPIIQDGKKYCCIHCAPAGQTK